MAQELPLKPRHKNPMSKKIKSTTSNSGSAGGKKGKATNGLAALARAGLQKEARAQSERNQMVMVVRPSGKRLFIRARDL